MFGMFIYIIALAWIVIFRKKSLLFSWKWLICSIFAVYISVLSISLINKMPLGFIPYVLRSYLNVIVMMLIFMAVLIVLNIIIEKLTPNGEYYIFPLITGKVLSVFFRGMTGVIIAVMLLQCASMIPFSSRDSWIEKSVKGNEIRMLRILSVVDFMSFQLGRSEARTAYLESLRYVPPSEEETEDAGSDVTAAEAAAAAAVPNTNAGM